jgi:threonine synthase
VRPATTERWRCSCGGLLDLTGPRVDPLGGTEESPLRRYERSLPPGAARVDLGQRLTPLEAAGEARWVKLDYEHPTGSFKDRGAAAMIGLAAEAGVTEVVADSSGNAGKSVAAHAVAAGMACTVYVPMGTEASKVEAMTARGASVVEVPGLRPAAAAAAQARLAQGGAWYASHVYQPSFHHGVKTLAFELAEQLPGLERTEVVVPAGNGTLVLGLWLGFQDLVAARRLAAVPAIVAVQAEACAPLTGTERSGPTAAVGIAIPDPPRLAQVRAAILGTGGRVETVGEDEIAAAREDLAARGYEVEPTGAVAWAATRRRGGPTLTVAVLTGR